MGKIAPGGRYTEPMKNLFILDSRLLTEQLGPQFIGPENLVWLFPLTSQVDKVTWVVRELESRGCEIKHIRSAWAVNQAAESRRDEYIRFIAALANQRIYKQKDLKGLFALDESASLWWFSLIAEKSTFKSDAFNALAQLEAIISVIKEKNITRVLFGAAHKRLRGALLQYCAAKRIEFVGLPVKSREGLKKRIKESQGLVYCKHILLLLNSALRFFLRAYKIKRRTSGLRPPEAPRACLAALTYYPNLDIQLAKQGIFSNRYYINLQDKLEAGQNGVIWLAMQVGHNAVSFNESLDYAQKFIKNGYSIFFIEEFSSVRLQLKALFAIFLNGIKFLGLKGRIAKFHTTGDYNFFSVFRDDWYSSFAGSEGYLGVLYYYMFRSFLEKFKPGKCFYLLEMFAWEKALISARQAACPGMKLFGYQSAAIARMLLNYFNHRVEICLSGRYCLPQPDRIICNSQLAHDYMKESGWPEERLLIYEATRYTHLKKHLQQEWPRKENIVLLAFSVSPQENSSLLNIACEAFKEAAGYEIFIRPHPALRLESVFELSGIPAQNIPFKIDNGRLDDILAKARVVLAGESSVSIEAIACGCSVVIVQSPEWINMSPLKGEASPMIKNADSPRSLKEEIDKIFREEQDLEGRRAEAGRIINKFFYLDSNSGPCDNFLKAFEVANR